MSLWAQSVSAQAAGPEGRDAGNEPGWTLSQTHRQMDKWFPRNTALRASVGILEAWETFWDQHLFSSSLQWQRHSLSSINGCKNSLESHHLPLWV